MIEQCLTIGVEVVRELNAEAYGQFLEDRKLVVAQQMKELEEKKQAKMLRTTAVV